MANKPRNPRILIVTPEITYLPDGMGNLAGKMSAKAGGMADVSASLFDFVEGIPCTGCAKQHLVQKAVGLACRCTVCSSICACPRLVPGDDALLQLRDDSICHRTINIE